MRFDQPFEDSTFKCIYQENYHGNLLLTFSGYILLPKLPKQHEIMGNKNIFAILFFHNNIPGIFPLGTHISLNRDRFHKPLSAIQKSKQL